MRNTPPPAIVALALMLIGAAATVAPAAQPRPLLQGVKRIVFLGDSITHDGKYIGYLDLYFRLRHGQRLELINLGLGSETVTGLTEDVHPFPRPNVHERLDRALAKTKPDLVFVCYGMNDGIYAPLDDGRFKAYQDGIVKLVERLEKDKLRFVLLTPTPFDAMHARGTKGPGKAPYGYTEPFAQYDQVLAAYAKWLREEGAKRKWTVIDLHTPMNEFVEDQRRRNPRFTMVPDGIHPNPTGHIKMATAIVRHLGDDFPFMSLRPDLTRPALERIQVLGQAWLSEVGHTRPGVQPGLPLDEAKRKAAEIDATLEQAVRQSKVR